MDNFVSLGNNEAFSNDGNSFNPFPNTLDPFSSIVRTILLEVMKKAAHRIEYKCNATIAPMDSFNQILSGLLETAGHLANPIVSFCWRS